MCQTTRKEAKADGQISLEEWNGPTVEKVSENQVLKCMLRKGQGSFRERSGSTNISQG